MSFSQTHILKGIFSSSSLFSQMSKLPLNLPAQFTMLKPFSQGLVISRLISLKLCPLQASALIPSSPFIQSPYLLCHPQILLLPSQCSSHQSLLFSHSAPCTTSFFFFSPLPPLFTFILALLSSPRRQFVHDFLPISYQSFLYMPETWSGYSTLPGQFHISYVRE